METLNILSINIEIVFPESYPIDPPQPSITYPRFTYSSLDNITISTGAITMESITNTNWVPNTNMELVINEILTILNNGEYKIDN